LRELTEHLERKVYERTNELNLANQHLQEEIAERKRVEEKLRYSAQQLETLRQVSQDLGELRDLDTLLHQIVERAIRLIDGDAGGIYLYQPERQRLEWTVMIGESFQQPELTISKGEGVSGKVWETGMPLIINDYSHWSSRSPQFDDHKVYAVVGVPIQWGDEFLGVLNVRSDTPGIHFTTTYAELLSHFATYAAIAIKNARLHEELDQRVLERTAQLEAANKELALLKVKGKFAVSERGINKKFFILRFA